MKKLIYLFFALLLFACEDKEVEPISPMPQKVSYALESPIIEERIHEWFASLPECAERSSEIVKVFPYKSEEHPDEEPLIEILQTKECGYMIISTKPIDDPILGVIPNQTYDPINTKGTPLDFYLRQAFDYSLDAYEIPVEPCHFETSIVGYWLKSKWDQDGFYNQFCPPHRADGKNKPAGCVPVAVGQVLSYYKTPLEFPDPLDHSKTISMDWKGITANHFTTYTKEQKYQIAKLIRYIGEKSGVDYTWDTSSCHSEDAIRFMSRRYTSIHCSQLHRYDFFKFKRFLDNHEVVYMRGNSKKKFWWYEDGHAWLIDGYVRKETCYVSWFVHCNWGWSGLYNGYFRNNVFDYMNRYDFGQQKQISGDDSSNYKYNLEYAIPNIGEYN